MKNVKTGNVKFVFEEPLTTNEIKLVEDCINLKNLTIFGSEYRCTELSYKFYEDSYLYESVTIRAVANT